MFLALNEMKRAKVRFALLIAAVALLVFLILFQQALQNGLLRSFVGAIENQSAPVLVYSVDGQKVAQASVITPPLEQVVRGVEGAGEVGRWSQGSFSATADGELVDISVVGYEIEGLGSPSELVGGRVPSAVGEVVVSDVDADTGFGLGERVRIEPSGLELTVVGLAAEAQLNAGPTLFGTLDTYAAVLKARNPDAGVPIPNLLAVRPAEGVSADELVRRIDAASTDLEALTREDAAANTPGVAEVRSSFQVIFLLYGIVVPLVIGLFFLIVTFQKANALTLLRAIGARGSTLVRSLLVQVAIVLTVGFIVGVLLYLPLSSQRLGSIPLRFETGAVVIWAVIIAVLGVLSSLVAGRRVLRIDPIAATTGAGVGK